MLYYFMQAIVLALAAFIVLMVINAFLGGE